MDIKLKNAHSKSALLRNLLEREGPILTIGAHNGLGARMAQEAGFDAIWASGLELSAAAGLPDASLLSMRDFLDGAIEMDRASSLPVICDCDTGFGNAINVIHAVRSYEAAGLAGVCFEDKVFPKLNSFVRGRQNLVNIEEFQGKIEAAKANQKTDQFVVIARVEALVTGAGMDEALKRATAYQDAGADLILIHSKQPQPDEIITFLECWKAKVPIVVVPTTYPQLRADELHSAGAKLIIYANQGLRAAVQHMTATFEEIVRERSTRTVESKIANLETIFDLQELPLLQENEKLYVRGVEVPQGPLNDSN